MADGQDLRAVAQCRQTGPGLFRLHAVHIRGIEVALSLELFQHPTGVAAVPQGGVIADLAGADL